MMQIIKRFSAQCKSKSDHIKSRQIGSKNTFQPQFLDKLKVLQIMASVSGMAGYGKKARGFGKPSKTWQKRGTDE